MELTISLARMYTAILRGDLTNAERDALAASPKTQQAWARVQAHVWHPTPEELLLHHLGMTSGDLKHDIDFHLDVDRCSSCPR